MGVDYEAKAGYGVQINNNLTDEYQSILEEKYDNNIYEFVEEELSKFKFDVVGNMWVSDYMQIYICSDKQDILKFPEEFNKFKDLLEQNKHILKNIEPEWYCELYIG